MKNPTAKLKRGIAHVLLMLVILIIPVTAAVVYYSQKNRVDKKINAQVAPNSPGVVVAGNKYYLLGVNYPWASYGSDFGTANGVNSGGYWNVGGAKGSYDVDFADMKAKGVHTLRWNIFEGNNGITYDSSGKPIGLDSRTIPDLKAAVALARKYNIYINFVLTDFSFFNSTGGHTDVFSDSVKTAALINNVVNPILDNFTNEPYILSWEIMNEPEWIISDIPQPAVGNNLKPITMVQFWNFANQVSQSVHSKTKSYVTVGSAALKWNKIWTNSFSDSRSLPRLNLDYYQTHYYPWMDCCTTNDSVLGTTTWSPLTQNASALGLDKPIVVGEIPDNNTYSSCGGNCLNKVLANGYAGYWAWSYKYNNTNDKLQVTWSTYTPWEAAHSASVRIPAPGTGGTIPTPTPNVSTPTPTPSIPTPTPTPAIPTPTPSPTPTPPQGTSQPLTGVFKGEFFNNTTLTGSPVVTITTPIVNYNWGMNAPMPGVNANFSAKFTGTFNFDGSNYRFNATGDDGIRVKVDGTVVIDGWRDQQATTYNALKTLSGVHTVVVEFYDSGAHAVAQANWVHASACFDMTGDGKVTQSDVNVVSAHNGTKGVSPWSVNGDKRVNVIDLQVISAKVGTTCS